jgi:hypothetical protein
LRGVQPIQLLYKKVVPMLQLLTSRQVHGGVWDRVGVSDFGWLWRTTLAASQLKHDRLR